jgi:23S rRNA-/tRNA-specific pseudouridylate synthase
MNINKQAHIHESVSQQEEQHHQETKKEQANNESHHQYSNSPLVATFADEQQDERQNNQDLLRVSQKDESAIKYQFSKHSQQLSPALVDNPCWGGPEEETHNLSYLLDLIASGKFNADPTKRDETIILHNDKDFLVIDKPPDLRMDGPYPATVHKLVTYWFPPPSLTKSILEHSSDTDLTQSKHRHLLLEKISKISKTSDVTDNIIRSTHQLDYATSGVLLMAKSREAAAIACQAFADRATRKEYLAIVHHNIERSFPVLTKEQEIIFSKWMDGSFEDRHRKEKKVASIQQRKGSVTFVGYLPPHSIFSKWKGLKQKGRKRKREEVSNGSLMAEEIAVQTSTRRSSSTSSSNLQNMTLMKPLVGIDHEEEEKLVEYGWKEIKQNPKYKKIFMDLAQSYNATIESNQKETRDKDTIDQDNNKDQALPTFFRRRAESEDAFYCCAPLADDPDNFRVVVTSQALRECNMTIQSRYGIDPLLKDDNDKSWDFKPSLTRFVVLKRGFWNDLPVTKLLLQPRTGRRHQLRVHTAILGHSILGDCTYCMEDDEVMERNSCSRMCLHASKLSIPLRDSKLKVFIAPDPFVGVI